MIPLANNAIKMATIATLMKRKSQITKTNVIHFDLATADIAFSLFDFLYFIQTIRNGRKESRPNENTNNKEPIKIASLKDDFALFPSTSMNSDLGTSTIIGIGIVGFAPEKFCSTVGCTSTWTTAVPLVEVVFALK